MQNIYIMASSNEFLTQESADLLKDIQDEGLLDEEFVIENIVDVGEVRKFTQEIYLVKKKAM